MTRWATRVLCMLGALGLLLFVPTAHAETSFEFLFSTSSVDDDEQWYLNLAVSNSGYSRQAIEPVLPRIRNVDADLPVLLLLARESGRSLSALVDLRRSGLSWSIVFGRVGVTYGVLFEGIDRDPGPPYGKAWGHWRKNPKQCRLSDDDIRGLVDVQTAHAVTGLSAFEVARARGEGKSLAVVVAEKKGRPKHYPAAQARDKGKSNHSGNAPERGGGAGRAKGRGKGK